jgi:hypothetical protein
MEFARLPLRLADVIGDLCRQRTLEEHGGLTYDHAKLPTATTRSMGDGRCLVSSGETPHPS